MSGERGWGFEAFARVKGRPAARVAGAAARQGAGSAAPHELVQVPSMRRNIRAFALGLCVGSPILLEGPPSSGKSALITHLAGITGNAEGAFLFGVLGGVVCAWFGWAAGGTLGLLLQNNED